MLLQYCLLFTYVMFIYYSIMLLFTYGQIFLLLLLCVALDKEVAHLLLSHKHLNKLGKKEAEKST